MDDPFSRVFRVKMGFKAAKMRHRACASVFVYLRLVVVIKNLLSITCLF